MTLFIVPKTLTLYHQMPQDSVVKTEMTDIFLFTTIQNHITLGTDHILKTIEETWWHKLLEQSNI